MSVSVHCSDTNNCFGISTKVNSSYWLTLFKLVHWSLVSYSLILYFVILLCVLVSFSNLHCSVPCQKNVRHGIFGRLEWSLSPVENFNSVIIKLFQNLQQSFTNIYNRTGLHKQQLQLVDQLFSSVSLSSQMMSRSSIKMMRKFLFIIL